VGVALLAGASDPEIVDPCGTTLVVAGGTTLGSGTTEVAVSGTSVVAGGALDAGGTSVV
jgi:hypothetical protein